MRRKSFLSYLAPRLIVCLLVGGVAFAGTFSYWEDRYNLSIRRGYSDLGERYQKLVINLDAGEYDTTFIDIFTNLIAPDYLRIAKVNDDGSFENIFETEYDVVPVENGSIRNWIYLTNNEKLLAQGTKACMNKDNEWKITYKKSEDINKFDYRIDSLLSNSMLLTDLSDVNSYSEFYANVARASGFMRFSQPELKTFYVEGDKLHIGKVTKVGYNLYDDPVVKKTWDFTDPSKANSYVDRSLEDCLIFSRSTKPEAFMNEHKKLFCANSIADLSEFESETGLYAGTQLDLEASINEKDANNNMVQGSLKMFEVNGHKYMMEYIVTTEPFNVYFKPALIGLAIALAFCAIVISLLASIRPYSQYKKAYENNAFKNNLIDSLAHNMKTPLQILGGYAENLKDVDDKADKDRYADRILETTSEMNSDIEAILKTVENPDRKFARSSVRKCVGSVIEKLGIKASVKGDMTLKMDEEYFKTALVCLLDNASKYKTADSEIEVNISDNEFTVSNKTDADKFTPGTGLAIAGRILEQHRLYLDTSLKDGAFTARAGKRPSKK